VRTVAPFRSVRTKEGAGPRSSSLRWGLAGRHEVQARQVKARREKHRDRDNTGSMDGLIEIGTVTNRIVVRQTVRESLRRAGPEPTPRRVSPARQRDSCYTNRFSPGMM